MSDSIKSDIERVEETVNDRSLAYEILKDLRRTTKYLWIALFIVLALWAATIAGFLLYMNQYDYSTTIEANGVYAIVDSNGNIISQDVTPEQWEAFTEWWKVNGEYKGNKD